MTRPKGARAGPAPVKPQPCGCHAAGGEIRFCATHAAAGEMADLLRRVRAFALDPRNRLGGEQSPFVRAIDRLFPRGPRREVTDAPGP